MIWPGSTVRAATSGVGRLDVGLAVGLFALAMADVLTTADYSGGTVRLAVAAALQTLPLLIRRTQPLVAVAVSLGGVVVETAGQEAYGGVYGLIGFLLLVHAVSRWAMGRQRWMGVGLLAAGALGHVLSQSGDGPLGIVGDLVMVVVFAGAAWMIGRVSRDVREREQAWERRHADVIEEERGRISREIHDVVGHALAGISLTAGAAEQRVRHVDPDTSSDLGLIRTMSRDAAADVRRLVGLLREQDDTMTSPQPTLESVAELVERWRTAGVQVTLHRSGRPTAISGGQHLAAFRVVQEGLTNVAKHAPGQPAEVCVEWRPGLLVVSVENPIPADGAAGHGVGHGLVGLQERVAVFDGTLTTSVTDGRYRLVAELPLS